MKIFPDHVIPGMVQFFVQSKDSKRRTCGAGEHMPVITKIYDRGSAQAEGQSLSGQADGLRWKGPAER